jgi:hypothetical protein
MTERRYSDQEVEAIFLKAAQGQDSASPHGTGEDGLTLSQLQEIGREVGISPDAVTRAAQSLELEGRARSGTLLGFPIRVERTIVLHRWLSEPEWERLVVQLREVFHARGTMSASGSFRQWRNGNLQALLEPTPTGHRLRLMTVKGNARIRIAAGLGILGVAVVLAVSALAGGRLGSALPEVALLSLIGIGTFASGTARLPRWARLRGRQMDAIVAGLALPPGQAPPPSPPIPTG